MKLTAVASQQPYKKSKRGLLHIKSLACSAVLVSFVISHSNLDLFCLTEIWLGQEVVASQLHPV